MTIHKNLTKPGKVRKAFRRYSEQFNRPLDIRDAQSRGYTLPSQRQYRELGNLVMCIQALEATRFIINTKLEGMGSQKERMDKHKERYKREPELLRLDPKTYTIPKQFKEIKARQEAIEALICEMYQAYELMTKQPYRSKDHDPHFSPKDRKQDREDRHRSQAEDSKGDRSGHRTSTWSHRRNS